MIELQNIIKTKRELLSRATYSRNPINYSAGMADDQKGRYIQYLAGQNQDLRLTGDAMKLVLEDFMAHYRECRRVFISGNLPNSRIPSESHQDLDYGYYDSADHC